MVPTPDGGFLFGTDTNVFPDPADGADDGVWIVHIIVVGGQWMDGWEGSAERESVCVRERKKKKGERKKCELTVSTHAVDRKSPNLLAF